ncbi:tetratricopeptide repeat protein 27 isoform X1 [Takifugu flavidus]|uniref:tetratricopeptide repeat protein 27 isoform X1 n=2 Tax=Takifugu flavidus TaxID=433684 RepID=UPI0025446DAD|nr:tetratricopeptide repeat protein 27 isoform X1 [Takifugu flavidus]
MSLRTEISILRGFFTPEEAAAWKLNSGTGEVGSLLESLMEGDFEAVLRNQHILDLLAGDGSGADEDIEAYLEGRVSLYLTCGPCDDQRTRELVLLVLAASCLHLFAQSNWTGPSVSIALCDLLPPALTAQTHTLDEALRSHLLLDGESVYTLVANPFLLLLARVILVKCSSRMLSLQLVPWWTLRYISLHQQILEDCSPQLHSLAQSSMDTVMKCEPGLSEHCTLATQFHLECSYISLMYYDYKLAKEHIRKAQELSGLDISMTGALGKRTHFQQKNLAQLVLRVERKEEQAKVSQEDSPSYTPPSMLPRDYRLNDDTVLDHISFAEPGQYDLPDLRAEEQAVMLGVCTDFQKNNPVHRLTEEQLLAFTSCILSQPKFWAVHVSALCLRTSLEKGSSRRAERGMMQLQAIVDHFEDQRCPVTERLKVFYCSRVSPRWVIQKQLAGLLSDLGCISSALLTYEKLQLWEDVVICYERLGQHGKAEEVVRRELEKKETPSLYCLLGDILKDHQYYDRAWELSGRRSARAMRSKALLHLQNKELQQGVSCFQESLRINTIQLGVWFALGCAYLALEDYEGAARGFHRCVGLEPDNAEAWNNLSTAYIRLRMKQKAFHTLREALKCNFEHWQIWENYITVCTDIGDFSEAVSAYHRLMDLRENYKDVQILQILVGAVVENLTDSHGEPAATMQPKMKELLGRVGARHSSDAHVWQAYARLYGDGHSSNPEDNEKALELLSKELRCRVRAGGWEADPLLFKEVIQRALHLGEVTVGCSNARRDSAQALQTVSTSRLTLSSLSARAKQRHTDVATGQVHAELQEVVNALDQLVSQLQELNRKLREQ